MQHQGQYPVIFISFKDIKTNSYDQAISKIRVLLDEIYTEYQYVLDSDKLTDSDKEKFNLYLKGQIDSSYLEKAISYLCSILNYRTL